MTKGLSVGQKLEALNALQEDLHSRDAKDLLQKSLADRSNYVVQRAAELMGESGDESFIAELLSTYRHLQIDASKSDPGCLGKTAIIQSLIQLGHTDADTYRDGIAYEQPEPVWGGRKDSAAELRGLCALGLINSAGRLEVLNRCAGLLADSCAEARTGAARAIGALAEPEGAPLLRLKLLVRDKVAEVHGECCAALLRLDREGGIATVASFLSAADPDVCVQTALALGDSRQPQAFAPLRLAWQRQANPVVRESLLICIGLLRSSESREFLLSQITRDDLPAAADAIKALKVFGEASEVKARVAAAVKATGQAQLERTFTLEWG